MDVSCVQAGAVLLHQALCCAQENRDAGPAKGQHEAKQKSHVCLEEGISSLRICCGLKLSALEENLRKEAGAD